jgi:hypothetical protein
MVPSPSSSFGFHNLLMENQIFFSTSTNLSSFNLFYLGIWKEWICVVFLNVSCSYLCALLLFFSHSSLITTKYYWNSCTNKTFYIYQLVKTSKINDKKDPSINVAPDSIGYWAAQEQYSMQDFALLHESIIS